jgi:2,4-dienoyl-CoA reductase-like NADH-dependent reductase (Old Yellow Enzyme family)
MGGMTFGKPRPLTLEEIKDLVDRFAFAAKALYDAGADGIQLHAAVSRLGERSPVQQPRI